MAKNTVVMSPILVPAAPMVTPPGDRLPDEVYKMLGIKPPPPPKGIAASITNQGKPPAGTPSIFSGVVGAYTADPMCARQPQPSALPSERKKGNLSDLKGPVEGWSTASPAPFKLKK